MFNQLATHFEEIAKHVKNGEIDAVDYITILKKNTTMSPTAIVILSMLIATGITNLANKSDELKTYDVSTRIKE